MLLMSGERGSLARHYRDQAPLRMCKPEEASHPVSHQVSHRAGVVRLYTEPDHDKTKPECITTRYFFISILVR